MYDRNLVYDFDVIVEPKPKRGRVVRLPSKTLRSLNKLKSQRLLLTGLFSVFSVVAVSVSIFLFGQAKLTEITEECYRVSKSLEQCKTENTQLSMKLKSVQSLKTGNSFLRDDNMAEIVKVHSSDMAKIS